MMIPTAISLGFGVLFATLITLVMMPSLYLIIDDLAQRTGGVGRTKTSYMDSRY